MKTRIRDLPQGFSFEYQVERYGDWHFVGGHAAPQAWATAQQRDRARSCFSTRRSVKAALADLSNLGI